MKNLRILLLCLNFAFLTMTASEKKAKNILISSHNTVNSLMPEILIKIVSNLEPVEQSKMRLVSTSINQNIKELTKIRIEQSINNFFLYPNNKWSKKKLYTLLESNNDAYNFFYNFFLEKLNPYYLNKLNEKKWLKKLSLTVDLSENNTSTYDIIRYQSRYDIIRYKENLNFTPSSQSAKEIINTVFRITPQNVKPCPSDRNILEPLYRQWKKNQSNIRLILKRVLYCEPDQVISFMESIYNNIKEYKGKDPSFYDSLQIIDFTNFLYGCEKTSNQEKLIDFFEHCIHTVFVPVAVYWLIYQKKSSVNSNIIPYPLYTKQKNRQKIIVADEKLPVFALFLKTDIQKHGLYLDIVDIFKKTAFVASASDYGKMGTICHAIQNYRSPFLKNNNGVSAIEFLLTRFFSFNRTYPGQLVDISEDIIRNMEKLVNLIEIILKKEPQKAALYRDYDGNSLLHLIFGSYASGAADRQRRNFFTKLVNLMFDLPISIHLNNFSGESILEFFLQYVVRVGYSNPDLILELFKRKKVDFEKSFKSGQRPLDYIGTQLKPPMFLTTQNQTAYFLIVEVLEKMGKYITKCINKKLNKNTNTYPY